MRKWSRRSARSPEVIRASSARADCSRCILGPDQIVAAIGVDFIDTLSAADVERIVAAIEERVRNVHPQVVLLLIKPQSGAGVPLGNTSRLHYDGG